MPGHTAMPQGGWAVRSQHLRRDLQTAQKRLAKYRRQEEEARQGGRSSCLTAAIIFQMQNQIPIRPEREKRGKGKKPQVAFPWGWPQTPRCKINPQHRRKEACGPRNARFILL